MSAEPRFGTDGIRGIANEDLTPELALKLGMAAAHVLLESSANARIVVGRDTRISGDMLESALCAGLSSMGAEVVLTGVIPTPGVSQITLHSHATAGAVISASHNPYKDNGIKFFGADGKKLSDEVENRIEAAMDSWQSLPRPTGGALGRIHEQPDLVQDYVARLTVSAHAALDGLKLVIDCANGAASAIAPSLFSHLGSEVIPIHHSPDGININVECGSTSTDDLCEQVRGHGADAGLAFDGDCDRVMMCDENGRIVDGDMMMAICALSMKERGELANDVVVATIMSNAALEVVLRDAGIELRRAKVGDKYVAEMMEQTGAVLGGEQSGHILFPRLSPTGDGMLTSLQALAVMKQRGKPLSRLDGVFEKYPQELRNVNVSRPMSVDEVMSVRAISEAMARAERRVGNPVWVSVRPSGTEKKIRVMVQDRSSAVVQDAMGELCGLIQSHFGS